MNIPISYKWLRSHFDHDIPSAEEISKLFLKHLCEVEGMEKKGDDTIFDLKIMPDRGHDLLSHCGIAHEVSVLTEITMKAEAEKSIPSTPDTTLLRVDVSDQKQCPRYIGRVIEGVKVGPSPDWLRERLESVGQRSINNIVDVTNYVMLDLGQPMHAFDGGKLACAHDGAFELFVRPAHEGEAIKTLDEKDIVLTPETLVIADGTHALAIAGVKGGKDAGVDENTTTIVLESANFDGVTVRKTSQRVGIRTDSSRRFEHVLPPSLAKRAMNLAVELILEMCPSAKVGDVVDVAIHPDKNYQVGFALSELNGILGLNLSSREVEDILKRLGFDYRIVMDPLAQVVELARVFEGKPYKFGASVLYDAPETFDCSSFTAYLWKESGVAIPRMTIDQYVFGEEVALDAMTPGDFVFSNSETGKISYESVEWMKGTKVSAGVDHVGIYLGDGRVVHASRHNASGVAIENLKDSSSFKNIVGVRRIVISDEPRFVVTIPLERLDLRIKEDLAEEIGRVYGFHNIEGLPFGEIVFVPQLLKSYMYANTIRDVLTDHGFSEVFTYSFQNEGAFAVANPIAEDKGFLRKDLATGLTQSLVLNARNASLLGLDEIKIFEIGKVYPEVMQEKLSCAVGIELTKAGKKKDVQIRAELERLQKVLSEALGLEISGIFTGGIFEFDLGTLLEKLPEPKKIPLFKAVSARYEKPSAYPFVLRDIALWATSETAQDEILSMIRKEAGDLLVRSRLFDVFTKEIDGTKKTSFAFNLVFQSYERTLSDVEINEIMERITEKLIAGGFEVR